VTRNLAGSYQLFKALIVGDQLPVKAIWLSLSWWVFWDWCGLVWFWVVPGFELRTSHLLGSHCTI
jgi:hypothetical protein